MTLPEKIADNILVADHRQLVSVDKMTRDDVVPYYASLIVSGRHIDVSRVNQLILSKWTPSGLLYIKDKAWKTEMYGMTLYERWIQNLL
jgi:hypothetical protein